ncbi:MAG: alpha/beta hydrolase [Acidimicrobiia bacterium]|nr:alpha/beta hydrolase [Acidimicrobiia bacterium]
MQRKSQFTDIEGPVHYIDYGGEGSAVVMLHGLGGSHLNWDRIGPGLAADHGAYALDLRGFGLTPLEGNTASMENQVELVAGFIRKVAGGRATIFGNSMGGTIAMLVAAEHPDLVDGLVLFGPGLPPQSQKALSKQNLMFLGFPLLPAVGEAAMQRYFDSTPPEERIDFMMQKMTADPFRIDNYTRESLTEMVRLRNDMEWQAAAYCQALRSISSVLLRRSSFRRIIHKIAAPTLIIHGMLDDTVPFESGEWLARERPDWKFAPLMDCGHVPQLELPKRSLNLYRRWRDQELVTSS